MEAAENLEEWQLIAMEGSEKAFEKWGAYINNFVAVGKELGSFVKHGGIYDCFFVLIYKFQNLLDDDRVDDRFLDLKKFRGFIQHGGVYDCFFVLIYKFQNLLDDYRVDN